MTELVASLVVTADAAQVQGAVGQARAAVQDLGRAATTAAGEARLLAAAGAETARELGAVQARSRETAAVTAEMADRFAGVGRAFRSAAESAQVFAAAGDAAAREVAALRAAIDPAFAAAQRYARAQEAVAQAVRLGSVTQDVAQDVLARYRAEAEQAAAAVTRLGAAQGDALTSTRGGASSIQNFAFQIQDFATQVGAGTAASVALGQQLPQLLSGFGLVGAIAGTVAAVLLPLSGILFGLAGAADRLGDALEDAAAANDAFRAAGDAANATLDQIAERYGTVTSRVLELLSAQRQLAADESARAATTAFAELVARLDEFTAEAGKIDLSGPLDFFTVTDGAVRLSQALDISVGDAARLAVALSDVAGADGLEAQAQAADRAADLIEQMGGGLAALPPEARALVQQLRAVQDQIEQAIGAQEKVTGETIRQGGAVAGVVSATAAAEEAALRLSLAWSGVSGAIADADARASFGELYPTPRQFGSYEETDFRADPGASVSTTAGEFFLGTDRTGPGRPPRPAGGGGTSPADRIADLEREAAKELALLEARRLGGEAARAAAREVEAYYAALDLGLGVETAAFARAQAAIRARLEARDAAAAAEKAERDRAKAVEEIGRQYLQLVPSYEADAAAAAAWRDETLAILGAAGAGAESYAAQVEAVYQARLADAYDEDLARRTDWAAGVERAFREMEKATGDWAATSEDLVKGFSREAADAFVSFARTGKFEVGDLVDYTVEQLARLAFQSAINPALNALVNAGSGFLGDILGGVFRSSAPTVSVPSSPISVSTLPPVTGLRSPLSAPAAALRGAPAAGRPEVKVEVRNMAAARVNAGQRDDGTLQIDIVDAIEGELAGRVATGRGRLAGGIQAAFGLSRNFGGKR